MHSFRVEVKHNIKNTVIFDENVTSGATVELINNDHMPLVPSGAYTVTIYGGSGLPKGQVLLTQSKEPFEWPHKLRQILLKLIWHELGIVPDSCLLILS